MSEPLLSREEDKQLDELVAFYQADLSILDAFAKQLLSIVDLPVLADLYHSRHWRVKLPSHLRGKLVRKLLEAKKEGENFDITTDNLFKTINDLVGIRLLHLHTTQFEGINRVLLDLLDEHRISVIEGPEARTWDDENRDYFERLGVKTISNKRLYTSVHYVIAANRRTTTRTAEIQVRTLAEELWGEVDHSINYPTESTTLATKEEIRVLARVASSCTRLVDAIFATHNQEALGSSLTTDRFKTAR